MIFMCLWCPSVWKDRPLWLKWEWVHAQHIWWLFFVVVLQHWRNKPVCTGGLLRCASLKFQLRGCRWVVSTLWEHPVTYLKPTSSWEKHQYLQEYTEASKILKPLHLLHGFSVLVPVSSHIASSPTSFFFFFLINISFQREFTSRHFKRKTPTFLLLDSKVKLTFLGRWEECCPLGLWTRSEDYESGISEGGWDALLQVRLGCQYHRVVYTDFNVMLIWSADESVKVVCHLWELWIHSSIIKLHNI